MTIAPLAPVPPARAAATVRSGRARRLALRMRSSDAGAVSAEYAVATVAACGFAGILYKILTSPQVLDLLLALFKRALSFVF